MDKIETLRRDLSQQGLQQEAKSMKSMEEALHVSETLTSPTSSSQHKLPSPAHTHPLHKHHDSIDHELTEYASKSILMPHLSNLKKASYSNAIKLNIIHAWHSIMMNLLPLGNATLGNTAEIYTDGDEAFREMWKAIDSATEEICYETYILKNDPVGLETLRKLAAAARRGVKVTFVYDYMGSSLYVGYRDLAELHESGAKVVAFNPILPHLMHIFTRDQSKRKPILFRNHRKIMVVDGKIGFCGGLNTSSDYAGPELGIARFRDTHMKLKGPAVQYLIEVFKDSLSEASMHLLRKESTQTLSHTVKSSELVKSVTQNLNRQSILNLIRTSSLPKGVQLQESKEDFKEIFEKAKEEVTKNWKMRVGRLKQKLEEITQPAGSGSIEGPSTPSADVGTQNSSETSIQVEDQHSEGIFAQVLSSNVIRNKIHLQNAMIEIIRRSGREVHISNPFLLPPKRLMNALLSAAERGVQVKVITSGTSDTPMMRWASTHIYHEFLNQPNIEIYEYQPRIMHAKTVTVDGLFCSIGSFNFDLLSGLRNLEVNVTLLDQKCATILDQQFLVDLEESRQVTLESLAKRSIPERFLHWFCYFMSRVLSVVL
eukprot:CAMPEP_0117436192 /NCGR_PEP_ID=MMETSP0759-20121206/880_1 /TAXON_ID=63605 /ORGANISM="Percolomonas cosmopolitus, Strain WS" /LENGTH=598 /DNA_ID=CAMNT_0005227783 /DNA_START=450 /DNA_END=2246 /DNA_ORIENTATION=-